jgi:hypothetical protein
MKLRHLKALFIVLLFVSVCDAEQIKMRKVPLKAYNETLSLDLLISSNHDPASGYYSINKEGVPDGPFKIESKSSGYDKQVETNYSFVTAVAGKFKNGKKDGSWKYEYVYDDGVDLYESHNIEIEYQNDKCIRSSFEGVIGYTMPKTKHEFKNQEYCTPEAIRNKAWEIWRAEFEKTQKGK